ncbi:MAG: pyridoxamine 5'-phosphate oxidase family protein [Candidatus Woesearchaeota archaeon]
MKTKILEEIKKHNICVLATCANKKPEAAVVAFVVDDNFIFYVATSKYYRKYKNLIKNKNVSLVIGFEIPTIQIDGVAEFLDEKEKKLIRPFMIEKIPEAEDFFVAKESVFIRIKPKYLKITDYVRGNYKINEVKF